MIKTQDYANILNNKIDTHRFYTLCDSLGPQLNDRKSRFDKSDILEQSIEVYSDGYLKWVDDIGVDHIDEENGISIEMKFSENVMYGKNGKPKGFVKAKIKNSLGKDKSTIDNPADFYMFAQSNALGIISFDDMKEHLVSVSDGIECKIPFDKVTIVSKKKKEVSIIKINYLEEKRKAQRDIIESII